ncbi:hypothetical protein [Microvirga calopogonii]|uniref:hypothetical protein n=1 Tax=Microvirga calopogonii TaxID=2078013 RepID=UPI000E0DC8C0|nr:hypothetical protein [Microvirga calopogonii]
MATRRLRLVAWHHRRELARHAHRQECMARHLIALASTIAETGWPGAAKRMLGLGLRFRVRGLCLLARASALDWRTGALV